ncbi:SDR family oxidoreductase [Aurantibacter aestuarii]|uniref:LPS biosynthesis protein WbpP n=1 Tax=Aurantibacter aestuarii TaxID=1266046 RepID=A0A2T1NCX6_9FLAO|nr:SDR family oxidoreductase [Aurantibacter aestuarii]PSG90276.1 LPS biosynthesis protein WbpP [Aurantibacter aestuarii]
MYETPYHTNDLSTYSFLVTGGAGFIGSNLVEYLLKYNAKKVVILDNLSNGHFKNIEGFVNPPKCEFIEGDIRNLETCKTAIKDIDYVLHQAALGSVPRSINDPITSNDVNVSGFLNMLLAVKESKTVKKMVYAASSSTYGDSKVLPKVEDNIGKPLSPYAITKYVNELYADVFSKTYGVHTIGLRYFNVFGPKQDPNGAYAAVIPLFMKGALGNKTITINGDGEQTRDFTFIENVVQANIKAVLSNLEQHEVFNVAVNDRISVNKLWNTIKTITNSKSEIKYNSPRQGDVKDSLADISKAKNLLNYTPKFELEKGLGITLDWFNNKNV